MRRGPRELYPTILALIAFAACTAPSKARVVGPSPSPSSSPSPSAEVSPIAIPATGTLLVTVKDQNGQPADSIPARIFGPLSLSGESDGNGNLRVEGPPGIYRIDLMAGCALGIIVDYGESRSFSITAGQEHKAVMRTEWKNRFGPSNGAYPSQTPDWFVGEEVSVSYDVVDRCTREKARGVSFSTFQVIAGQALELIGKPVMKSDQDALGRFTVRCTTPGQPSLAMVDTKNRKDFTDLLSLIFEADVKCKNRPH